MLISGKDSAFFALLLYAIAALNPETNRKPEKAKDPRKENNITIIHLSGSINHQSSRWYKTIRKMNNPRITSMLLILFILKPNSPKLQIYLIRIK